MKILVIELSNIGDSILTYPALAGLWRAYPDAECHVLASPRSIDLFKGDPRIRQVWIWEKRASLFQQIALIGKLFSLRFDLVVDFRHSAIPLFLLGARRTPLVRQRAVGVQHRGDQHQGLLDSLGIPRADGAAPIWFGPDEEARVSRWIEPGRRPIAVAPGSRSHLKRWSARGFAEVADRLIADARAQVLLVGDGQERAVADQVKAAMRNSPTDLTGFTTIRDLAALLKKAELLITNDSACLHAAEAMGTPAVALFGPTDERKYGPRHPRSTVVRRHLVCAPCERALCPYHHECMKWIEPDEVYAAAVKILDSVD